jgi:hypothetical protein
MVKVIGEEIMENKGVATFKLEIVPDPTRDKEIYDAGVKAETSRFEQGSFAHGLFQQFFPQPGTHSQE